MIKHLLKTLVAVLAIAATAANPAWGQNTMVVWPQTAYGDLQTGDTVVIVDKTSAKALPSPASSITPSTVSVTLNSAKDTLTGTPTANLLWVVTKNGNTYQFNQPGSSNYLYFTDASNGVRVGNNANKQFSFANGGTYNVPFLKNNATSSYLGLNDAGEWRSAGSNSSTSTIKNTVIGFYKKTVIIIPTYTVRFAAGTEEAANWTLASGNASVPGTQVLEGVLAGTPITATYAGDLKVKEVIATKHQEPNEIPLTIEALTAGIVMVQQPKSGMQYTLNGGPKTAMTEAYTEITVAAGDKVQLYGNGTSITSYNGTGITGTAEVKAYGNIMSLVNETGFDTATTLTANEAFSYLFVNYANLKDISGLKLPATTLTSECYNGMFYYCTGLTTVPSDLLPATTLARSCYSDMFSSCANLTNVPTLPATTLAVGCYSSMFSFCTGLTTVPTDLLPATTLAEACYSSMFLSCRNLTTAPALPATTLAERCYYCMFQTCENLAASPVLPATTLVERCYNYMFANCSNLSSVTCLATSGINQNYSTASWLNGAGSAVQGTKTFNAVSSAIWPNNSNGIPSGWTRQNIDN